MRRRATGPLRRCVVIAHDNVGRRFDRYSETAGYNAAINGRQFRARAWAVTDDAAWQTWRYPDLTYATRLDLDIGGVRFELHHAKGETDDHTWVHIPSEAAVLCGDLFIWVCPNAGNPQKVQRYPREWAQALREIIAAQPEVLVPAHNVPIFGKARIAEALGATAALLEFLVDETIALMNEGCTLEEVVARVQPPAALTAPHYLAPLYDEPEFIVRNVWRMYGGWYDGNPAHLKPAPMAAVAAELAAFAGGAAAIARRATELAAAGDLRVASELVELAGRAAPDDVAVHRARAEVYGARARAETSLMARSIFAEASEVSAGKGALGA